MRPEQRLPAPRTNLPFVILTMSRLALKSVLAISLAGDQILSQEEAGMLDFTGRISLVTGAGRGLGYSYAAELAKRGASVIVHDVGTGADGAGRDPTVAEAAAERLRQAWGRAQPESGPIGTREQCAALIARILAEHDRLDIIIHNAGWVGYQPIEDLHPDFLHRMTELAIDTPLWLAQAAWPIMRRRCFGRILLTTSDRAIYPCYAQQGLTAYAAAKMAAIGIVNALAREGEADGILVNAISPVAKTRMWGVEGEPDELKPEEVAPGAVYLVSPESRASGWVLRAANGQFVATRALEADGVDYPRDLKAVAAVDAEGVAAAWPRIAVAFPEHRTGTPHQVATAFNAVATLGECPIWSDRRQRLIWIDTVGRSFNLFDPATGRNEAWSVADDIGMVAERPDGTFVVGLGCDLAIVYGQGQVERIATAPDARPGFRFNDGRIDEAGRLWIGLMDGALGDGTGILYRYDPDGTWHVMDSDYTLINGLDWSPDRRTLYVTDSRKREIYAYEHDPETGTLGARRLFASFSEEQGYPDGLLVEQGGALWSVLFDGGAIYRFEPDGSIAARIELPVPRPTSCAFAHDGSSLFVTTARLGLNEAMLERFPSSGALLRVAVCSQGPGTVRSLDP